MAGQAEKAIQNEILLEITALPDVMFWREVSAKAWVGKFVERRGNRVVLENAVPVQAGVPGIADIMGVARGRAVALEVKTPEGSQEVSQRNFEKIFTMRGGAYSVVRSPDEAVEFLRRTVLG